MKKQFIFIFSVLFVSIGSLLYFKSEPMVSVILLTYNRQDLMPRALDSILNQTYKNMEIIVINDASSDKTADILKKYENKDKRIRVITNETNKGILYNRNLGLKIAKGKYLAWQDDDDVSETDKIEEQVQFMQKHKDIAILGTEISLIGTKRMVYLWPTEVDPEEAEIAFLIGRLPVVLATAMWRTDFIRKYDIHFDPEIPLSEDFAIYDKVLEHGGKIMTLRKVLYEYRIHRSNPKEYYDTIKKMSKKLWQNRWKRLFPGSKYPNSQCKRLKYIKEHNKYFKQSTVNRMYAGHCQTDIFNPSSYDLILMGENGYEEPVVISKNNLKFWSNKLQKNGKVISYKKNQKVEILWEGKKETITYEYK